MTLDPLPPIYLNVIAMSFSFQREVVSMSPRGRAQGFRITQCFPLPPLVHPSSLGLSSMLTSFLLSPASSGSPSVERPPEQPPEGSSRPRPWNSTPAGCTPSGRWLGAWPCSRLSPGDSGPGSSLFRPRQEARSSQAGHSAAAYLRWFPGHPPSPLASLGRKCSGRADGRRAMYTIRLWP